MNPKNRFNPVELILKKKRNQHHNSEEIHFLVEEFTAGRLPEYQMSAWLMAVCFNGMSSEEVATFTRSMKDSGVSLDFSSLPYTVDKHSTGGIGDKTSLILGPIVAAAGAYVPMIAGRGLGHTGGTLDKLESLPGFNIQLTESEFVSQVKDIGIAIMGQTQDLCPADRKLYALRDVTGTVDSLELICGSIMSKKLAEGIRGLVLDVKFGSGAFMKSLEKAEQLANLLKLTGEKNNLDVRVVFSNMDQPLGRFVGNGLEVRECLDIMSNKTFLEDGHDFYANTRDLSLILAGYMIHLANLSETPEKGLDIANEMLQSGKALKKFEELAHRQCCTNINPNTEAKHKFAVVSPSGGYISTMDCEQIGFSSILLGAGRFKTTDVIDHSSGIEINCYLGQKINKGHVLAYLYTNKPDVLEAVSENILKAVKISAKKDETMPPPLISKVL